MIKVELDNKAVKTVQKSIGGGVGSSTVVYSDQIEELHIKPYQTYAIQSPFILGSEYKNLKKLFFDLQDEFEGTQLYSISNNESMTPDGTFIIKDSQVEKIVGNGIISIGFLTIANNCAVEEVELPNMQCIWVQNQNLPIFNECPSLVKVTIGGYSSGGYCGFLHNGSALVFSNCPNMTDLYLTNDEGVYPISNGTTLTNINNQVITVHVPSSLVDTYKEDAGWGTLYTDGEIDIVAINE